MTEESDENLDIRQLVLRALNVGLRTHEDVRQLGIRLGIEIDQFHARISALEAHGAPADRAPAQVSGHDWSDQLAVADQILRQRVKDPSDKAMTSDRARAIAADVVQSVAADQELSRWRAVKSLPGRIAARALETLVTLAVGGAAVELAHWLVGR